MTTHKRLIVGKYTLEKAIEEISKEKLLSFDTETTGLYGYHGDRLFSIVIATACNSYYFNFQNYNEENQESSFTLEKEKTFRLLQDLVFSDPSRTYFIHNAKFDMKMLALEGMELIGDVHCTYAMARVEYNAHFDYTLDACAKRIGLEKSDEVDIYLRKNKLISKIMVRGKEIERKQFNKVPFDLIARYALQDAEVTYTLGCHQLERLEELDRENPDAVSVWQVYHNEKKLTKTLFNMEERGVKIDREFCQRILEEENLRAKNAVIKFRELSGEEFIDSANQLAKVFDKLGEKYPRTAPTATRPNGTPSFTEEVLKKFETPLAKCILDYRSAMKSANTYFLNLLHYADEKDHIHANFKQAGAETGRLSVGSPSLQNIPKEDDGTGISVRRSFIPSSSDFCFVMIDFDQMEFRLLLEYANEKEVIRNILENGVDVHQATADKMGTTRTQSKVINFMLLYGGGAEKLAAALNVPLDKAKKLKQDYFRALPNVKEFIDDVIHKAKYSCKKINNWFGRKYNVNPEYAFIAPNHLIQGGCADLVRVAMNDLESYLRDKKSKMILQIHDEILFEVHKDELHIVPRLKDIMEAAYPYRNLPLTCAVSHSWKSWGDKVKGPPTKPAE